TCEFHQRPPALNKRSTFPLEREPKRILEELPTGRGVDIRQVNADQLVVINSVSKSRETIRNCLRFFYALEALLPRPGIGPYDRQHVSAVGSVGKCFGARPQRPERHCRRRILEFVNASLRGDQVPVMLN